MQSQADLQALQEGAIADCNPVAFDHRYGKFPIHIYSQMIYLFKKLQCPTVILDYHEHS